MLQGLKKRLEGASGLWIEDIPMVLWSYHTILHFSAQETYFKMVYGSDAMIPIELIKPSVSVLFVKDRENQDNMRMSLDFIDEE